MLSRQIFVICQFFFLEQVHLTFWSPCSIIYNSVIRLRGSTPSYAAACKRRKVAAVAERPRDALCPSVVSLNKIIPRAESFIIVT